MFDVVDRFANDCKPGEMSPEYASACHECALALREEAGIPEFGKRSQSQWSNTVDNWMIS